MTRPILSVLAASFVAAGCATDPVGADGEQRAEREYRTGSNIARRRTDGPSDGPVTVSREELERAGSFPSAPVPKSN